MRGMLMLLILALGTANAIAGGPPGQAPIQHFHDESAPGESTLYRLRVDGMSCPFCAYGVEKRLSKVDGVEYVQVQLDDGVVLAGVAPGHELTRGKLDTLFEESGFAFRGMTSEPMTREALEDGAQQ